MGYIDNNINKDIIPYQQQSVTSRSSELVKRGLDSILSLESKTLQFPSDRSMGEVWIRQRGSIRKEDWRKLGKAQGSVTITKNYEINLKISRAGSTDLSPLVLLKPDDINTLSFNGINTSGTYIDDIGLRCISRLTSLKELNLMSCHRISDTGLQYICGMTSLRMLYLAETNISDIGLHNVITQLK
jgi:hypothetical protein